MTRVDLACVVHVHSTYSDGTATVPEIIAAARAADVDAVLLTDHDTLAARRDGFEGRHDGVLLVVGHEVSPKGGHFLAFGLDEEIDHDGLSEREIADAVAARGGLGFPAHPFSLGSSISTRIAPPHGWTDLAGSPLTGIEVWSFLTDAAEQCRTPREFVRFARRPETAMAHPFARALEAWDRLGAQRRVVGIGGLDAHQSGIRFRGRAYSPFPHERIFATLRTHVLCESETPDPAALLAAIAAGRCYLALDALAPARGFRFEGHSGGGAIAMGDELATAPCTLSVLTPGPAEIALLRDGEPVAREHGVELQHETDQPGVYRVVATRGGRTWILSNPIYLR